MFLKDCKQNKQSFSPPKGRKRGSWKPAARHAPISAESGCVPETSHPRGIMTSLTKKGYVPKLDDGLISNSQLLTARRVIPRPDKSSWGYRYDMIALACVRIIKPQAQWPGKMEKARTVWSRCLELARNVDTQCEGFLASGISASKRPMPIIVCSSYICRRRRGSGGSEEG